MDELAKDEYLDLPYNELLDLCRETFSTLELTDQQIINAEQDTKKQSKCPYWYRVRAGRVSGSMAHVIFKTKEYKPAPSAITSICYPTLNKITTTHMRFGLDNEKDALTSYIKIMEKKHINFRTEESGVISPFGCHT